MDRELLTRLAADVASSDLVTAREAVRDLKALLSPANLLSAWRKEDQRAILDALLREVEAVGDVDVFAVVADCLAAALAQDEVGHALLGADANRSIPTFLVNAIASTDLALASRARPAVLMLLRLTAGAREGCPSGEEMGHLIDNRLDAERSLRLFDCDAAESEENQEVYSYLTRYTTRVPEITKATVEAFDTDPLLLANYLVVSGIINQRERPAEALVGRVEAALNACSDGLCVAFVCRFCSIALLHREENAAAYADRWVRHTLATAFLDSCGEDTLDSVFDLAGSASTTASGWQAVAAHLPGDWLDARLRSRSVAMQLSAVRFLHSLLQSPYFDPQAVALVPLLQSAWQLRTSLEEPVRVAVWELVRAVVGNSTMREQFAASFASFLCGAVHEECANVRALQLKVASILSTSVVQLPEGTKEALKGLSKRGLYPPGSAGVADMAKD